METRQEIDDAAALLYEVRVNGKAIDGLPRGLAPGSLDDAYAVQQRLNSKLTAAGFGEEVGYKIGCTTTVMQDYLGIDHPCAGSLFESTLKHRAGVYQGRDLCRPGVECEIAVDIGEDILALADPTPRGIAAHVAAARASIELVDDRWTDFGKVGTPSLVSDNFFNAGCVVGAAAEVDPMRLDTVRGSMTVNGAEVGSGTGADILGHPLAALVWLAAHQIRHGRPLRAGQVVTLGSVVKTAWIGAGDAVEVAFPDIGRCSLKLA